MGLIPILHYNMEYCPECSVRLAQIDSECFFILILNTSLCASEIFICHDTLRSLIISRFKVKKSAKSFYHWNEHSKNHDLEMALIQNRGADRFSLNSIEMQANKQFLGIHLHKNTKFFSPSFRNYKYTIIFTYPHLPC